MDEGVVLVPGEVLALEELLEVGIRLQQGSQAIPDEFQVGVKFFFGGVEFETERLRLPGGLRRQRDDDGEQVNAQVTGRLAGGVQGGQGVLQGHIAVLRVGVEYFEGLDAQHSSIQHRCQIFGQS